MNRKIKILVDDKEIDYYAFTDEIRNGDYLFKENGEWYLHKKPTIIEENKKIEKVDTDFYMTNDVAFFFANKINEIIDKLNKENK